MHIVPGKLPNGSKQLMNIFHMLHDNRRAIKPDESCFRVDWIQTQLKTF